MSREAEEVVAEGLDVAGVKVGEAMVVAGTNGVLCVLLSCVCCQGVCVCDDVGAAGQSVEVVMALAMTTREVENMAGTITEALMVGPPGRTGEGCGFGCGCAADSAIVQVWWWWWWWL